MDRLVSNSVPSDQFLFHITHMNNLPGILSHGGLYSDSQRIARGLNNTNIGMSSIKQRRLRLAVNCYPGTFVGDYVPFYFCPRSIMLYILYMGNHPDLTYSGGQQPIIHLALSVDSVISWAENNSVEWCFSSTNAGASYTQFYNDTNQFDEIDWAAVQSNNFRDPETKEGKQAEFLVNNFLPFELISEIGVCNRSVSDIIREMLANSDCQPVVKRRPGWYY